MLATGCGGVQRHGDTRSCTRSAGSSGARELEKVACSALPSLRTLSLQSAGLDSQIYGICVLTTVPGHKYHFAPLVIAPIPLGRCEYFVAPRVHAGRELAASLFELDPAGAGRRGLARTACSEYETMMSRSAGSMIDIGLLPRPEFSYGALPGCLALHPSCEKRQSHKISTHRGRPAEEASTSWRVSIITLESETSI